MSGRTTQRNRVKESQSISLSLAEAQKKTGETTKAGITRVLSEKYSGVRYNGKTKTFYYS